MRLVERCRDAWAVLRTVSAYDGELALQRADREYDEEGQFGTRDGLADDMLEIADTLETVECELTEGMKAGLRGEIEELPLAVNRALSKLRNEVPE